MSGPDLHVFTLKSLALEKLVYLYPMQRFSAGPKIFSKKLEINFLYINRPLKLLINGPDPFI